jgi:hypothetical protein
MDGATPRPNHIAQLLVAAGKFLPTVTGKFLPLTEVQSAV